MLAGPSVDPDRLAESTDEPLPHGLDRGRHLTLDRRGAEPWVRRVVMTLLAAVMALALLDVFGQSPQNRSAVGPAGSLQVSAPDRVRGGLFFQGRFEVRARRRIADPRLVLARGWTEQLQLNTIEPSPDQELSEDGRLELRYGAIDAGERLTVWLQFEANPTGPGRRDQAVELRDGRRVLARIDRSLTIFP
jgi:hypothetical protein